MDKNNNPHYAKIRLPQTSIELLSSDMMNDIEYNIVEDSDNQCDNEQFIETDYKNDMNINIQRKPMVTQVREDSNTQEQFTICAM